MFRATHRPSSGAQNCNCSLWIYIRFWLPAAAMAGPSWTGLFLCCGPGLCHAVTQFEQDIVPNGLNRILSLKSKCWVFKSGWFRLLRKRQSQISHLAEHMENNRRWKSQSIILKLRTGRATENSLSCIFRSSKWFYRVVKLLGMSAKYTWDQ
jgi:hypothetical protein